MLTCVCRSGSILTMKSTTQTATPRWAWIRFNAIHQLINGVVPMRYSRNAILARLGVF